MTEPVCPLCNIRVREFCNEPPGPGSYYSYCAMCALLVGLGDHTHTYYYSPAQVAAVPDRAGMSWRTAMVVLPLMQEGAHAGYRCRNFDQCGWEYWFAGEDLKVCTTHTRSVGSPVLRGVCLNYPEHRLERGECYESGFITEYGREQEKIRSDAANWDPGRYIG